MQKLSSANQDIKQDSPIESDTISFSNHEKPQNEYNAESLIICKNFYACYKIDGNTKFFSKN